MLKQILNASLPRLKPPPIAIIGAGPCGLTLARLLQQKNYDFVVYERDETATSANIGGTLDIHPETGQEALRKAGLWEDFRKKARSEDDRFQFFDKEGKLHLEHKGDEQGGRPEIDRGALRKILLDSIPKDKVKWSSQLKAVELEKNGSPVLEFINGTTAGGFKLVVGTDGAWSKVRPKITQSKPTYSGRTYFETQVHSKNPLHPILESKIGNGNAMFLAGSTQLAVQRQGSGAYRIYFSLRVPEFYLGNISDPAAIDDIRDDFLSNFYGNWDEKIKDFVRHADNFRSWPLYQLPLESQGWESVPGLTLAGDAAHLALPNGGGVNCAMKDAMELVSKIDEFGMERIDTAVEEYERGLFKRGRQHIEDGMNLDRLLSHEDGPAALAREFQNHIREENK